MRDTLRSLRLYFRRLHLWVVVFGCYTCRRSVRRVPRGTTHLTRASCRETVNRGLLSSGVERQVMASQGRPAGERRVLTNPFRMFTASSSSATSAGAMSLPMAAGLHYTSTNKVHTTVVMTFFVSYPFDSLTPRPLPLDLVNRGSTP